MAKATYIKHFLFVSLLFMLFVPQMQESFSLKYEPNLGGSYTPVPDISFSAAAWFSGAYQSEKAAFLNENFGFRKTLVRLYNQIQYSCFDMSSADNVVIGKSNMIFLEYYIKANYGSDFLGHETLKGKVDKLAVVKDSLHANGVDFMVFLAPGKGSYFPEYAPEKWSDSTRSITNYSVFSELIKKADINLLDAKKWFEQAKDTSTHLLYPKTGVHWSKYGEFLVLDSVINRVEAMQGANLPNLVLDSVETSATMRDTDDDLERNMNLLFDIPDYEMSYPRFHFESDSTTVRPNVLTIGDSYYWGVYHYGLSREVYDNSEFWYYFETISPANNRDSDKVKFLNLRAELEQTDMVVLWLTESNVYSFGFIEAAYDAYKHPADENAQRQKQLRIEYYIDKIKADPEWFEKVKNQAAEEQLTVDEALWNNADYMVKQEE